ncbi:HEPN domain-containing protein [Arthrobacter silvisoli]|uniref:HEPN domain-containing protein n=1 Tax=Arthrobacter silvisoli TaxID=2291022 RepID=UPI001443A47F|nr:HEPN domain-containing protein [Arthrobacter silvisoli]
MSRRILLKASLANEILAIRRLYLTPRRPVPRDKDLVFGDTYLVAAHAALESYFEELSRRVLISALWKYQRLGQVNTVLETVLKVHHGIQIGALPRRPFSFRSLDEEIKEAADWYVQRIGSNNGIKSSNLYGLLLPLGFNEADFDTLWLANMDSFGGHRGDIAHGRSVNGRQSAPLTLNRSGTSISINLLPQAQARSRVRNPCWEVDRTLNQILPEAYDWDNKCLSLL